MRDWINPTGTKKVHSLVDKVYKEKNLRLAWERVKANRGAGGVDGQTLTGFGADLDVHLKRLHDELRTDAYQPQPVRQVMIPKPGSPGQCRPLVIPTIFDRVCQQALVNRLEPIFEPEFDDANFGYRRGRSAKDALRKIWRELEAGYEWVVDADLKNFFDQVNHDILMGLVAKRVSDKRLLKLIRACLNAGVLENGLFCSTERGTPQGGPLSPLLSNLMLDVLDRELERRGHRFVRYADDSNIYVCSRRAGQRVMQGVTSFVTRRLKLKVNAHKSAVARPWQRSFLGFGFTSGKEPKRRVAPKSIARFKQRARELTRRTVGVSMPQRISRLAAYLRGWRSYYGYCQTPSVLEALDSWVRRRLRAAAWKQWKRIRTRYKRLRQRGVNPTKARHCAFSSDGPWRLSASPALCIAFPNAYFDSLGLPRLATRGTA